MNRLLSATGTAFVVSGLRLVFTRGRLLRSTLLAVVLAIGIGELPLNALADTFGSGASISSAAIGQPLILTTSQSPFNAGLYNQGWWSDRFEQPRSGSVTDNYLTGLNINGALYRGFFTFDLSDISGTVVSASIEIPLGSSMSPVQFETLGLFDVTTPAAILNSKPGVIDTNILNDLGTGNLYASKEVTIGSDPDTILQLFLNDIALFNINAQRGDFFSVGASIISLDQSQQAQYVFGHTSSERFGPIELYINVVPEPDASLLFGVATILQILSRWSEHKRKPAGHHDRRWRWKESIVRHQYGDYSGHRVDRKIRRYDLVERSHND
jgi:hypothetical protein